MSSEAHGSIGYSAAELRDAMTFYGIPGRADIEGIPELDDMRGDGIDVGSQGHGENTGNVNLHALSRRVPSNGGTAAPINPCGAPCCSCPCRPRCLGAPTRDSATKFGLDICSGDCDNCAMLGGCDVIGWDDEPSAFAADYFGGDETAAGEWAESMLSADILGEDDLYALGWDPFKSIKKAVRPLTKTVKAAAKGVTKVVSKVPVVGKVAAAGLRTAGAVTGAAFKLNPVSLLKNPKGVIAAQLRAAKSAVSTAKQTVGVAKQLVKSPVIKAVAGGAAVVFPPIGVPAAAALATAAAVANAVDSKVPAARAAAQRVVENTARLAQSGDKGAELALSAIATQKKALLADKLRTPPAGSQRVAFDVNRQGRISRVAL